MDMGGLSWSRQLNHKVAGRHPLGRIPLTDYVNKNIYTEAVTSDFRKKSTKSKMNPIQYESVVSG